jgi:hypothetical protein
MHDKRRDNFAAQVGRVLRRWRMGIGHNKPGQRAATLIALFLLSTNGTAQQQPSRPDDPCGLPDTSTATYKLSAIANWGYGFDSLRADITRWTASPFVKLDSIGKSVLGRTLYQLTIQDTVTSLTLRKHVWIHARTHPCEVQGTRVTNEIIRFLLSDTPAAKVIRRECVFDIVPMINPDGVELARPRENANNVDIESNWAAVPGEPEVQALRARFVALMAAPNPIQIALNMHSSTSGTRYFVYHAASGTSDAYATIQQRFIGYVRNHFPGGIQPYTYFVSWVNGAPLTYPESWFWYNHHEAVLALTYEDVNSASAGGFDSTATALLLGIADELGISTSAVIASGARHPQSVRLYQNYPNPFNPSTTMRFELPEAAEVKLAVYDILGREVSVLVNERKIAGSYELKFDASGLSSGVYFYRLQARPIWDRQPRQSDGGHAGYFTETNRLVLLK